MFAPRGSVVRGLLAAACVVGAVGSVIAQRGERRPAAPELRGVVKSVDAAKGTITVTAAANRGEEPTEKTLPLAKDAEVVTESGTGRRGFYRAVKLTDLTSGTIV